MIFPVRFVPTVRQSNCREALKRFVQDQEMFPVALPSASSSGFEAHSAECRGRPAACGASQKAKKRAVTLGRVCEECVQANFLRWSR